MRIGVNIIGREGDIAAYVILIDGTEHSVAHRHLVESMLEALLPGTTGVALLEALEHYFKYLKYSADLEKVTLGRVLERLHDCLKVEVGRRALTICVTAARQLTSAPEHSTTFLPILVASRRKPVATMHSEFDELVRGMLGEAELWRPY